MLALYTSGCLYAVAFRGILNRAKEGDDLARKTPDNHPDEITIRHPIPLEHLERDPDWIEARLRGEPFGTGIWRARLNPDDRGTEAASLAVDKALQEMADQGSLKNDQKE